jgi:hypothetical protein
MSAAGHCCDMICRQRVKFTVWKAKKQLERQAESEAGRAARGGREQRLCDVCRVGQKGPYSPSPSLVAAAATNVGAGVGTMVRARQYNKRSLRASYRAYIKRSTGTGEAECTSGG